MIEIKPGQREYVLAGFKYKIIAMEEDYHPTQVTDKVGWLLGEDLKPTREIEKALILPLEWHFLQRDDTRGCVYVNGLELALMPKEKAEGFLLSFPLPRKRPKKTEREIVFAKFGGRCAYCGKHFGHIDEMQVDHIVSHKNHGGEDSLDNYYPACQVCNRVKKDKTIEEFRDAIRNCARIHSERKEEIMADSDTIAFLYGLAGPDWATKEIKFYFESKRRE